MSGGLEISVVRALWFVTAEVVLQVSLSWAATVYVAPDGDDNAAGTLAAPFATLGRAQACVGPGDTVYIRGGTYRMRESQIARRHRIWAYVHTLDRSGTPGARINYHAYPNETPVFDLSDVKPPGLRVTAFFVTASWIHLKGLDVVGVQVTAKRHTQSICFENNGSHNIYEALTMHDGQAIGIYALRGSNNLFLNCDAYRNHDFTSEDGKGGNVDGFGAHPARGSTNNVFRGCRAWLNSDDGFDCISASESVTFEHCRAHYNGYSPTFEKLGDGNGFKIGGFGSWSAGQLPRPVPRHTVRFCLAVRNRSAGFYANHHVGGSDWFNNTAYRNGANFNFLGRLADNVTDVPGYGHKARNNLSYKSRGLVRNLDPAKSDVTHNSFNMKLPVSDADFMSVDETELLGARLPDGRLPSMTFLLPVAGGCLVDRGVDIGFPFRGAAPDLGAFENE